MSFQTLTITGNVVMPTITLSRCDQCCALVQTSDQMAHEAWHQTAGMPGPVGATGAPGAPGDALTEEKVAEIVDELERRQLRRELTEEQAP